MAESARRRAYVSATDDLQEHRKLVAEVLRDFGYEDIFRADLDALAACDLYVAIIGWHYNSRRELEYDRAWQLGKPRLTFIVDPKVRWTPSQSDKDRLSISRFHDRIRGNDVVRFFTGLNTLRSALKKALEDLSGTQPHPAPTAPSPQTTALIQSLTGSPERIARLLACMVLADRSRLGLLESPNTAGVADALTSLNARSADGLATFIGRMDDEPFEPDPLWLAWITNIHRERLTEISSEILRVSGLG